MATIVPLWKLKKQCSEDMMWVSVRPFITTQYLNYSLTILDIYRVFQA